MDNKKPSVEDANKKIDLAFDNADQLRIERLTKLTSLQRFKQRASVVERRRLNAKYGAGHPRVLKVEAKLKFNEGFIRDINIEKDKSENPSPIVNEDGWMVHGRVLNEYNTGISGLTASLFDRNKRWVKELGFSCTNEKGYFAITYFVNKGRLAKLPEFPELFLTITDEEKRILHQEGEPLIVAIGQIDYREIILSATKEACASPEPKKNQPEPESEPEK